MRLCTDGERLFALIRNEIFESLGSSDVRWSTVDTLFEHAGQTADFANYMRGAVAVHSVRRLLRYWSAEKQITLDESTYVRRVKSYVKTDMFYGLSETLAVKLARAVVSAEKSSLRPITPSVRSNVLAESRRHFCYLCGFELNPKAPQLEMDHLTLEHLWPTSIGGNSIEENLLPACARCQDDTKDTMSWEWLNVHNLVLPPDPSVGALTSVTRKERVARHFQHAITLCHSKNFSLKESFLQIGPMNKDLRSISTGVPVTFFDLNTI